MATLCLGTAQLGSAYGVTNSRGRLGDADLDGIIQMAHVHGIVSIDTAPAYGNSQTRLAPYCRDLVITTKVKANSHSPMLDQVRASLSQLGVSSVRTLLIHDWFMLDSTRAAAAAKELSEIRELGLVSEIGVSGYEPADIERALKEFDRLDAVQFPASALDSRLNQHSVLADLKTEGTRIQARSVFLQGLLAAECTVALGQHADVVRFHAECREAGISSLEGALAVVRALPWVSEIIVGVTSGQELGEIFCAWDSPLPEFMNFTASQDLALIDPRNWA
ncbi:MAG: aldo/keto reductase [Actinomycetes bacterium]